MFVILFYSYFFVCWLGFFPNISLRSKRFLASSSRKLGREQKKKERTGEGEDLFFGSCSNFRAVTRLETLATQATPTSDFQTEATLYILRLVKLSLSPRVI